MVRMVNPARGEMSYPLGLLKTNDSTVIPPLPRSQMRYILLKYRQKNAPGASCGVYSVVEANQGIDLQYRRPFSRASPYPL